MNRPRLVVVLVTALAVTFGGVTSASAGGVTSGRGPEIISVSDVHAQGRHSEQVSVQVKYRCEGKDDRGWLDLLLRQRSDDKGGWKHEKVRYEADHVWAKCDGRRHLAWVELWRVGDRRNGGYVHNGDAKLDVTLTERWGDEVSETFWVQVRGAGRDRGH